jgi:adenylylsulfate kinase
MIQSMASKAFAIWITGLPASGKSTIVSALKLQLEGLGLTVEVSESDEVRRVITPTPTYSEAERDLFTARWHSPDRSSWHML